MFHFDITAEVYRIVANSDEADIWEVLLYDCLTGASAKVTLNAEQFAFLVAFQLAPDGVPHNSERGYELLEPLFKGLPEELRMIP